MIEVGYFIRCGTAGIKIVTEVIKSTTDFSVKYVKDEDGLVIKKQYISKASADILDILEKDDYVNEHKVCAIGKGFRIINCCDNKNFKPEEIETILTHEQFKKGLFRMKKEVKKDEI